MKSIKAHAEDILLDDIQEFLGSWIYVSYTKNVGSVGYTQRVAVVISGRLASYKIAERLKLTFDGGDFIDVSLATTLEIKSLNSEEF